MQFTYVHEHILLQVINLRDVPYEEIVNIFLKFTWELYVLEFLKSPRVIEIIGSINTVSENTLILEVTYEKAHLDMHFITNLDISLKHIFIIMVS